jgi:hypothetical protein
MLEEELRRTPHLVNASLHVFAGRVQSAARSATEGVYRGRVFIAPLFRLMRERGEVGSCPTTAAFKARLLRAHARGLITLAKCTRAGNVNPLIVAASAVRRRRATFHVVLRWPRRHNVKVALEDTLDALDPKAYAAAEDYARKVHEDEQRREGRPRLITLSPDAFAARVQAVTNEASEDVLIGELFEELDARGEATGIGLEAFKGITSPSPVMTPALPRAWRRVRAAWRPGARRLSSAVSSERKPFPRSSANTRSAVSRSLERWFVEASDA